MINRLLKPNFEFIKFEETCKVTGEKPYTFSTCVYLSIKRGHLMEDKQIHTEEKPYDSVIYKKRFPLSSNLKHKNIRMDVRACQCNICLSTFNQKGNLSQHIKLQG